MFTAFKKIIEGEIVNRVKFISERTQDLSSEAVTTPPSIAAVLSCEMAPREANWVGFLF